MQMAVRRQGRVGQFRLPQPAIAAIPGAGRPEPPELLNPEEASYWREYVTAMPDGWFTPEMQPLLRELCTHVVVSDRLHGRVINGPQDDVRSLNMALRAQAVETKFILDLSAALRLTHKSKKSVGQAANERKLASKTRPWTTQEAHV